MIINAIEAMRDVGEEERELLISTRNEPDGVSVEVRDSGPGFAPETLERVFEAFYTHETGRFGDGPVDLPFDYRSAWRPIMGEREPAPRRQLSIRPAGDRKRCVVMLHS